MLLCFPEYEAANFRRWRKRGSARLPLPPTCSKSVSQPSASSSEGLLGSGEVTHGTGSWNAGGLNSYGELLGGALHNVIRFPFNVRFFSFPACSLKVESAAGFEMNAYVSQGTVLARRLTGPWLVSTPAYLGLGWCRSSDELLCSSSYCLRKRFLLFLSIFCLAGRTTAENSSPVSHKRRMDFLSAPGLKGKQRLPGGSGCSSAGRREDWWFWGGQAGVLFSSGSVEIFLGFKSSLFERWSCQVWGHRMPLGCFLLKTLQKRRLPATGFQSCLPRNGL